MSERSLRRQFGQGLRSLGHAPGWQRRDGIGWVASCRNCPRSWAWGNGPTYPGNVASALRYAGRCGGSR